MNHSRFLPFYSSSFSRFSSAVKSRIFECICFSNSYTSEKSSNSISGQCFFFQISWSRVSKFIWLTILYTLAWVKGEILWGLGCSRPAFVKKMQWCDLWVWGRDLRCSWLFFEGRGSCENYFRWHDREIRGTFCWHCWTRCRKLPEWVEGYFGEWLFGVFLGSCLHFDIKLMNSKYDSLPDTNQPRLPYLKYKYHLPPSRNVPHVH